MSPMVFIAVLVLLILRMGWPGIIPFAIFGLFLFICFLLSKLMAKMIVKLSHYRYIRTSRILQAVNGNKMIKMLNWENYI